MYLVVGIPNVQTSFYFRFQKRKRLQKQYYQPNRDNNTHFLFYHLTKH